MVHVGVRQQHQVHVGNRRRRHFSPAAEMGDAAAQQRVGEDPEVAIVEESRGVSHPGHPNIGGGRRSWRTHTVEGSSLTLSNQVERTEPSADGRG